MLDITKYYNEEELKKKKRNNMIEITAKPLSGDEVYDQALIEGGIGVDPTIKLMMDQAQGKDTTQLQMYHGLSSSGMQIL